MVNRETLMGKTRTVNPHPFPPGFWIGILLALSAAIGLGLAVTTPARSGPLCMTETCITFPYTDVAAFVPGDYIWMVPALLMALLFPMLVVGLREYAARETQFYAQIALVLAVLAAAALTSDYMIQLLVVQPSLVLGEVQELSLWSSYNPHGIFILLEDLGYLLMGTAFLFIGLSLNSAGKFERFLRWLFIVGGVATLSAFIVFVAIYGFFIEYRFEVAAIVITWGVLIVGGLVFALWFRVAAQVQAASTPLLAAKPPKL